MFWRQPWQSFQLSMARVSHIPSFNSPPALRTSTHSSSLRWAPLPSRWYPWSRVCWHEKQPLYADTSSWGSICVPKGKCTTSTMLMHKNQLWRFLLLGAQMPELFQFPALCSPRELMAIYWLWPWRLMWPPFKSSGLVLLPNHDGGIEKKFNVFRFVAQFYALFSWVWIINHNIYVINVCHSPFFFFFWSAT